MRIPRLALMAAAIAALTIFVVPALGAPAQSGTLSYEAPVFAWDGGAGSGAGQGEAVPLGNARCTPAYQCEDTLLEIKQPGPLVIEIKAGAGSNDLDLRLYPSDSSGTAPGNPATAGQPGQPPAGNPIAEDISTKADAKVSVKNIKPGFYVAQVAYYSATAGVYTGTATLTPPPPAPAATPVPTATPAPTATPKPAKKKTSKRAACQKKAKKIKNKRKRAKALKKCKKIKR